MNNDKYAILQIINIICYKVMTMKLLATIY